MEKRILRGLLCVLLAACVLLPIALPVTATQYVQYSTPLYVSNNGTSSYTYLPVTASIDNVMMATRGFMGASGLDARMLQGSTNTPFMLATDRVLTIVPSCVPSSQANLSFTTGSSDLASFDIITGYGGYVTVGDAPNLEWSSNGSLIITDAYINLTAGASKDILNHYDAVKGGIVIAASATTSNTVNATIYCSGGNTGNITLDYESTNTDFTTIPDHANFSFTNGAGTDLPFSISFWAKPESLIGEAYVSKYNTAGNQREWVILGDAGTGAVSLQLEHAAGTNYLRSRTTTGLSAGSWQYVCVTYDGSETYAGIKIYINGVPKATSNEGAGTYTGMTAGTADLLLGAFNAGATYPYDGMLSHVRIFRNVALTPAQVLSDYHNIYTVATEAYYPIHEGVGNPQDKSGNGHNASANVADWVAASCPLYMSLSVTTASSEHDITPSLTTNNFTLNVGGTSNSVSFIGSVQDSTGNWIFGQNNVLSYAGSVSMSVAGIQQLYYAPSDMIRGVAYSAGTVTVTNGSPTVVGAGGAAWASASHNGTMFKSADGKYYRVSSITDATHLVLSSNYAGGTLAGQTYNLYPRLPDRSIDATENHGAITWGANPAGVTTAWGAMSSSGSTAPAATTTVPVENLPAARVSGWFGAPDLARLATNPVRPFVMIVVSNVKTATGTPFNEGTVWQWLGLAFVLFCTMAVAVSLKGHLLIAGLAAGGSIGFLISQTIWPIWSLVFAIMAVIAGIIAERSPQV